MGPPPMMPSGIPVTAGAAAVKQGFLQPTTPQRGSMPPPSLAVPAARSTASSTSSRPSLASDVSNGSGLFGRSPRPSFDERIKTPLQESMGSADNIGVADIDAQFEDLLVSFETHTLS